MKGDKGKVEAGENSESASSSTSHVQRPRRNIMHKNAEFQNGLLWTEEKDLKKALYASLQDSKKSRFSESEGDISEPIGMAKIQSIKKRKNDGFRNGIFSEESSNLSPKRAKVHAQRKFAQGSNPTSPSVTPVKFKSSTPPAMDLLPLKRPKTEDFLTFLCFRGTSVLPPSLDYFNVDSKPDRGGNRRYTNSVNGSTVDRLKPNQKFTVVKGPVKSRMKSQPPKHIKTSQTLKKAFPKEELSTSTESSLSDTDDEICKRPEKNKPVIFDMTKKKTIELDGLIDGALWPDKDVILPHEGANPGKPKVRSSVQALKNKYRQQRLAKQKKALVKAKKSELAITNKKEMKVTECKNGNEKAHVEDHLKKPPKPTTIKRNDMQAASTKDSTHKELVRPSKSGSKVPLSSNTTSVKVKPTSAKSSKTPETLNVTNICKPVTRQAAMLLQAARQNEEKKNTNVNTLSLSTKAVKSEKKVKVKEDSTTPALSSMSLLPQPPPIPPPPSSANVMDKHLPLLASEHSYVKRLPDSPTEVAPKSSKLLRGLTKQRLPSDFSSDDDEPLARKQKVSSSTVIKKSKYLSGNDQQNMEGPKHPSKSKGPGKFLRSSKDVVTSKMVDVPKTSTGRLSRKTKEAATVYLELLGQKLYSGEDDYDVPVKKKKTLPKGASKKIHLMADSNKFKTVPDLRSNHRNTPSSANKGKGKLNVSESMLDISSSSTLSSTTTTSSSSSPFDNDKERPGDKPSDKCKLNKPSSGYNTRTPNAHLNRTDVIKTRDYMKKLSEAQFNLDKAQGKKSVFNKDGHQKVGTQKVSKTSSVSKNAKPLMGVSANEGTQQCQETQMSALKVKSTLKDSRVKNHPENQQDAKRNFVQDLENSSKRTKSKLGPKARVQNVNIQSTDKDTMKVPERSKNAPLKKSNVFRSPFKPPVKTTRLNVMMGPTESTRESRHGKVKKRSFKHRRSSSSSSSSSFRVPIPIKRGPGRVPAIHALRCYPSSPSSSSSSSSDSSSTSSSESSDDYPSKPESTTISVRQNVTSASVAVQVNLLNDISDLDDDFWEPGFLDTDLEGLFAMDRVVTPTLCKSSSPSMSQSRSGLELDATPPSFKAVKSGDPTPTKKMTPTPEKVDLPSSSISDRLKAKHPIKDVKPVPSSLPSCSPLQLKRSLLSGRRPKPETSEDDSSDFQIPLLASSGVKDAPVFYPSTEEFQDPLQYIEKIRPVAEKYGVCKIIPPESFKPECKVNDEMRFTAHNQYVHKMFYRWGPNTQQMAVIRKTLESQGVEFDHPPLIGGMELDLPRLYQTVQQFGGLKEVIEKKKWQKVADSMKIAKSAQDRVTKLYDAYCKYLLPYDALSKEEKMKLERQICTERQRKKGRFAVVEECVTKGRSMSLSSFYRIARNTMAMWSKNEPKPLEVEQEYWSKVKGRQHHVCVHAGNVDSSTYGYGFPCNKSSPFARHQWNLKVLTNNSGSVLRCMGPVMGITIPTLHVGMLFTTGCWYRDPHCLPWIEYLHAGANKIWYGIPANQSCRFREAMAKIVPDFCGDTPIWLPSDTAMVPPNLLVENGVSLCRLVQNSGQFVVVFPRAFTSTICCGYTVSESVYFAAADWLEIAPIAFKEIADSCEPAVFSLQRLIISIANDSRVSVEVLPQILPLLKELRDNELSLRKQLYSLGLKQSEHISVAEMKDSKKRWTKGFDEERECDICRANCSISMVVNSLEDVVYCLSHGVEHLQKKRKDAKFFKLLYKYDQAELNELVQKTVEQIDACSAKKKNARKPLKKPT